MLATDKESVLSKDKYNRLYFGSYMGGDCLNQHIYFLSDENDKPKDGDYIFNTFHPNEGIIRLGDKVSVEYVTKREQYKKIIATTDSSISNPYKSFGNQKFIPQLPQSFIEKYIGNIIKVSRLLK